MQSHIEYLAYAFGKPDVTGKLKQSPSDFIVTEQLSFTPSGEGEHLFLFIQKTELNTLDVCERLAKYFHVNPKNISYAGLKDKNAIVTQWFCLPFAIKSTPNVTAFESEHLHIVSVIRNAKKLKRGAIKLNNFEITLRDIQGDFSVIEERIKLIKEHGVPNYFGMQRFGRNENNLSNVTKLFAGKIKCSRNKKSIYLSAARSFLFNEVLSQRIKEQTWNKFIDGDVAVLNESRSFFNIDEIDNELNQRLAQGDIHPSAPLWGKGKSLSSESAKELEESVIAAHANFAKGLVNEGLQQDRRSMRLLPTQLEYTLNVDSLIINFNLPSGTYATSVLREVLTAII